MEGAAHVYPASKCRGFLPSELLDQRELQRRYDHIHRHLDVRGARTQLSTIGNAGFRALLERLDDLNIIVGADTLFAGRRCASSSEIWTDARSSWAAAADLA